MRWERVHVADAGARPPGPAESLPGTPLAESGRDFARRAGHLCTEHTEAAP